MNCCVQAGKSSRFPDLFVIWRRKGKGFKSLRRGISIGEGGVVEKYGSSDATSKSEERCRLRPQGV